MFDKLRYNLTKPTCCTKCGAPLERTEEVVGEKYDAHCGGLIHQKILVEVKCPHFEWKYAGYYLYKNGHAIFSWKEKH